MIRTSKLFPVFFLEKSRLIIWKSGTPCFFREYKLYPAQASDIHQDSSFK